MSDGAAAVIFVSEEGLERLEKAGASIPRPLVKVTGIGRGTDAMRMSDRPHVDYDTFMRDYATELERGSDETRAYYKGLWANGTRYPGIHSFRAGTDGGQPRLSTGRNRRSARRSRLRRTARCLHVERDPDI